MNDGYHRIRRLVPLVCILLAGCGPSTESTRPRVVGTYLGDIAPEIEGEDIEGKTFKLSDYRGKVVLLDFWGHW